MQFDQQSVGVAELKVNDQSLGFTLIELMITVVIVAILAAVAIPSYRHYVINSRLSDATNNLAAYRIKMEQNYGDAGNYGTSSCAVPVPTSRFFTYTCTLQSSGQSFLATATGMASFGLSGYVYTIDDAGNQVTTAFPGATVPRSCWLINLGDC